MSKEKIIYLPLGILTLATAVSGVLLTADKTLANTQTASATVTVVSACTLDAEVTAEHTASIMNGTYQDNIGTTSLTAFCNDTNGFAIYATGANSGSSNTAMSNSSDDLIATGLATAGNTSAWAMKVSAVAGSSVATIQNGFDNFSEVPATQTMVASRNSVTDAVEGSTVETTYAVYVSPTQEAGTYTGKVFYTMVHPATAEAPEEWGESDI